MPDTEATMSQLWPEDRPEGRAMRVDPKNYLDQLSATPAPSQAFLDSIQRFGVLEPVILVNVGWDTYVIADGRRRMLAVNQLGMSQIPALVFDSDVSVLTLVANAQRSPNPLSEYDAICKLLDRGYSEKEIVQATGLAPGTVKKRMKLGKLTPVLTEAYRSGLVSNTVAEAISGLPSGQQAILEETLAAKGRLSAPDVKEAKLKRRDAATQLPMFEITEDEVVASARQHLESALSLLGGKESLAALAAEVETVLNNMKEAPVS